LVHFHGTNLAVLEIRACVTNSDEIIVNGGHCGAALKVKDSLPIQRGNVKL